MTAYAPERFRPFTAREIINDYFINRVIHGDSLIKLMQLPDHSVDFVLTDPPYVVRYKSRDGRSITNDDRTGWIEPAFAEVYRVLKPNRFCVSFYGWNKVDVFMSAWKQAGFYPAGHIVWVKDYQSSERFLSYRHEQAYLLAKGRPDFLRYPLKDVLRWKYTGNKLHPNEKSVYALRPVVGAFSRPGEIVLDPFCGSGSTLLTARDLGRNYIGIDIDEGHCRTARGQLQ